jgi:hypothetical protein
LAARGDFSRSVPLIRHGLRLLTPVIEHGVENSFKSRYAFAMVIVLVTA